MATVINQCHYYFTLLQWRRYMHVFQTSITVAQKYKFYIRVILSTIMLGSPE
jgi:hypothetical protein